MASGGDDDKRSFYGPRPVAALVSALVRPAFRQRAPATAQVLADWEAIVGPAIAAVTVPKKLFAGTLSIACSGPMAIELQHLADQLIGRINVHLGRVTVTRLRFVQNFSPPAAPAPRRVLPPALRRSIAGIEDEGLREALERLGSRIQASRPD